jgi:hypothetical protein
LSVTRHSVGYTRREANSDKVKELRSESAQLKKALAETLLQVFQKSAYEAGS